MGSGGHNVPLLLDDVGIRKLTPRECFNLQGFPNNYQLPNISDSKLYKLAGNAVSIPIVELIANNIIIAMKVEKKLKKKLGKNLEKKSKKNNNKDHTKSDSESENSI